MVFKKMLSALGVGAPSVDTVLAREDVRPGEHLEGSVAVVGGSEPADIEHVTVALATRVEVESGDGEYHRTVEFHRVPVAGQMRLEPEQRYDIPFSLQVPWETPITAVYGQHLRGMTMGVQTELAIERAVDQGDLDPVQVHPLPVQERILDAFARLGYRFARADVEQGGIRGVAQSLPFYQEIEFYPPAELGGVNEVEVTFVAGPEAVDVVLEFDRRSGLLSSGGDVIDRFTASHADAEQVDWPAQVDDWVRQALERRGGGGGMSGASGGSLAGAALGAAGGVVAGMAAGELLEEIFDDD